MINLTRYRLNRKDGRIYQEREKLVEIGESLLGVIIWHSETFQAQLFGRSTERWVQLTILSKTGELGYVMLNSGLSSALQPWLDYLEGLREQEFKVTQVLTKIHFDYVEAEDTFDYAFQAYKSPSLEQKVEALLKNQKISLVDRTLPIQVVRRLENGEPKNLVKSNKKKQSGIFAS